MPTKTEEINLEILFRTEQADKAVEELAKGWGDFSKELAGLDTKKFNNLMSKIRQGKEGKSFLLLGKSIQDMNDDLKETAKIVSTVGLEPDVANFELMAKKGEEVKEILKIVEDTIQGMGSGDFSFEEGFNDLKDASQWIGNIKEDFDGLADSIKEKTPSFKLEMDMEGTEKKVAQLSNKITSNLQATVDTTALDERVSEFLKDRIDLLKKEKKILDKRHKKEIARLKLLKKGDKNFKGKNRAIEQHQKKYIKGLNKIQSELKQLERAQIVRSEPLTKFGQATEFLTGKLMDLQGKFTILEGAFMKNGTQAGVLSKAFGGLSKMAGNLSAALLGFATSGIGIATAGVAALAIGAYLLDKRLKGMNKELLDSGGTMAIGAHGAGELTGALQEIRDLTTIGFDFASGFRATNEELRGLLGSLQEGGMLFREMADQTGGAQKAFDIALTYSKLFGMGMDETGRSVAEFNETLNAGLGTIQESFTQITLDAKKTGMSAEKFLGTVQSTSAQFSLYGGRIKEVSKLLATMGQSALMSSKDAVAALNNITGMFEDIDMEKRVQMVALGGAKAFGAGLNNDIEKINAQLNDTSANLTSKERERLEYMRDRLKTAEKTGDVFDFAAVMDFTTLETRLDMMNNYVKSLTGGQGDLKNLTGRQLMIVSKQTGMSIKQLEEFKRLAIAQEASAALEKEGVVSSAKQFQEDMAEAKRVASETVALDKAMGSIVESGFNWLGGLLEDIKNGIKKGVGYVVRAIGYLPMAGDMKAVGQEMIDEANAHSKYKEKAEDKKFQKLTEDLTATEEANVKAFSSLGKNIKDIDKLKAGATDTMKMAEDVASVQASKEIATESRKLAEKLYEQGASVEETNRAIDELRAGYDERKKELAKKYTESPGEIKKTLEEAQKIEKVSPKKVSDRSTLSAIQEVFDLSKRDIQRVMRGHDDPAANVASVGGGYGIGGASFNLAEKPQYTNAPSRNMTEAQKEALTGTFTEKIKAFRSEGKQDKLNKIENNLNIDVKGAAGMSAEELAKLVAEKVYDALKKVQDVKR